MRSIEEWEALPYDERKKWLDISYKYYNSDDTFQGTWNVVDILKMIRDHKFETLLDYGTGTGGLRSYTNRKILDLTNVKSLKTRPYDPYSPNEFYRQKPNGLFDLVTCTDVLEHLLPEDADDVIWELVSHTKKMLYCTIACYPASKMVCDANGVKQFKQSLHTLVRPPRWWREKFAEAEQRLYQEQKRWISINLKF